MTEWNDNLLQTQLRSVDAMNIDEFPEYVDFQNSPHHHSQQQQQQQHHHHHHQQQQQTSDQPQQQPQQEHSHHHQQQQHSQASAHSTNAQDFSDFLDGFMDDPAKGGVNAAQFDNHSPHIPQHPQMASLHQVNGQNSNMTIHVSPNDIFSSPLVTAQNPSTNENNFTPLMSPVTTPLEHPNRMPGLPDFNMPGAFFSPTNSPLIEATVQGSSHHNRRASGSRTWRTPSSTPTLHAQSSARVTKTGRTSKPQPRSKMNTPQFPDHESGSSGLGSESVSPEELPDIAMPPPQRTNGITVPVRKPSTSSTASTISAPNTPATPASLMNLPPGEKKALLSSTDEKIQNAIRATTSGFVKQPAATSRSRRSSGASSLQSSPHLTAIKPKPKGITSAAQARISPVIKPKMSPSSSPHIMPMAKERSTTDLSALLASKSNYQNIVEGNHNQLGLSYPDQLSADLTSKKTSHKLAEQGRRNRINIALQELGELVATRNGGQVQSKATTVETAIRFIKELRRELEATKAKLAKYEDVPSIKQEDKIKSSDDTS